MIDPQAVETVLQQRPDISIIAVCHHDTPSGTLNPLAEIGAIAARHGAYLIVDAVSSFGGMDVHPEAVHADIFITSPSKCLGSTPGLTLAIFSELSGLERGMACGQCFSGHAVGCRNLCSQCRA